MRISTLMSIAVAALFSVGIIDRSAGPTIAAEPKPNVVYIMADELGYYELSCMGSRHIRTPNIDRMAQEGIRFTNALAGSSLCAPTRCTLMTGKHSGHTSVRTNGGGTPLRENEETIASMLKRAGYSTGGFGKWGCGGRGSTGVPEKHGFDEFFGYYDQVHAHSYFPPYLIRNSQEVPLDGNQGGRSGKTYAHYEIVERAKEFIRRNKDQPFFCYLPVTPPHGMFDIPAEDPAWSLYKDKPWPLEAKRYAAMVTMLDRNVGEIIGLLKELKLDENTIVFFCGDNGGNDYFRDEEHPRGFYGANVHPGTGVEFRGKKGNLYEGGLRIPMIVRWPNRIQPGRVSDLVWYFPDVLPTVAELAVGKAPTDIDGISILPELLGPTAAGREQKTHSYLYWELGRQTAVRMGSWKAIRTRAGADWELYDLRSDVSENKNVASDHPDIVTSIKAIAAKAHQPAVEGTFHERENHEKDRRAKWGGARSAAGPARVNELRPEGLISNAGWKIVRVSSQSESNGRLARCAIDGDSRTHWHSSFSGQPAEHPHELVIDMGKPRAISGFRYLARQDAGWNGALGNCEFYVGDSLEDLSQLATKASFKKSKKSQEIRCKTIHGRYVRLRVLSSVTDGPWASISELGVVGK